ncbi:MAG: T9SS type A sorting domain-containing protein [Bacteroidetes bacterium]|nr:T9SS type A sorting domain-containing protein [Bacteroidota bacterium]
MKKNTIHLFLSLISTITFAQSQFTSNNCFQLNDSSKLGFVVVSQSFDNYISQTGNNYTWDFTTTGFPGPWGTWTTPTISYKFQPSSQSIHSTFQSTQINEYANVAFARDHFYSYSPSSDTLYFYGYYAGSNHPYYTPFPYLTFPLSYTDSVYTYTIQKSGNTVVGSVTRDWIYDGFGTVKFSYGTENNVYRIRTKQIDTSMVNNNFISATVSEEIIWFRQSDGVPILRFVKQGATAIYAYYASVSGSTGVIENELSNLISVYPNPSTNYISIKSDKVLFGSKYMILDQTGRQVLTGKLNNETTLVDISQLATGVYLFQVGELSKKTFKVIKK